MKYNSGAVEGTVNRIKQLKAAMYGRAKPTFSASSYWRDHRAQSKDWDVVKHTARQQDSTSGMSGC